MYLWDSESRVSGQGGELGVIFLGLDGRSVSALCVGRMGPVTVAV